MSKRNTFNLRAIDEQELKRAVKNFNAKVTRQVKKNPDNAKYYPEKVSYAKLRDEIKSRHDLNREVNSLRRFSEKGAEELVSLPGYNKHNINLTKWQKEDMQRRAANINKKRARRRTAVANIEMTDRGKKLGYKKGDFGMGSIKDLEISPTSAFTDAMEIRDLRARHRALIKESTSEYWNEKDRILKENYIDSLEKNFNSEDVADIVENIENMSNSEFRKVFEAEGGNFELSYPGDKQGYEENLSTLNSIWNPKRKPKGRGKKQ